MVSVLLLGLGIIRSCILRFLSGIKLKLFLTNLLKPLEENLTLLMLIKLKRLFFHPHIAKVGMLSI